MSRLRRFLPTPETIRANRWLAWLGPALHHPRLWHLSRRGLALGIAIGIFFGLLVPIAQIPLSAAAAVVLRANLPSAVASTLVSNPATFGPLYYFAWRLGSGMIGEPITAESEADMPEVHPEAIQPVPRDSWLGHALARILSIGRPLLLGLAILAVLCGIASYLVVSWLWVLRVLWLRRRRLRERAAREAAGR
jgi:uncharacterized protein